MHSLGEARLLSSGAQSLGLGNACFLKKKNRITFTTPLLFELEKCNVFLNILVKIFKEFKLVFTTSATGKEICTKINCF